MFLDIGHFGLPSFSEKEEKKYVCTIEQKYNETKNDTYFLIATNLRALIRMAAKKCIYTVV